MSTNQVLRGPHHDTGILARAEGVTPPRQPVGNNAQKIILYFLNFG